MPPPKDRLAFLYWVVDGIAEDRGREIIKKLGYDPYNFGYKTKPSQMAARLALRLLPNE